MFLHRIGLGVLYPPFADKLVLLVEACAARGAEYIATSGMRSYDEQDRLYAKGRSIEGRIVTNAPGGSSPHNFGVACDLCRDGDVTKAGLQPDYDPAQYEILAEEAERLGLQAGLRWRGKADGLKSDPPHVQLPTRAKGITWGDFRAAYSRGGYQSVYRLLDARGPW